MRGMTTDANERISWFPIAGRDALSSESAEVFDFLTERLGFVPNVFRAFAWKGPRFDRWREHFDLLMQPTPGLGKLDREMISVAVSMVNGCLYCLVAHGFSVRALIKDPVKGDRVTYDYRRAGLEPRQVTMLDYAVKITKTPADCSEEDIETLRGHGFSDEDIWDIGAITAFFGLSNRMANLSGMRPNDEFYLMGRLPREKKA